MTQKPLKDNDYYQTPVNVWLPLLGWLHRTEFDVDPCSPMDPQDYTVPARIRFTEETNGLANDWGESGSHVFLNPPYSNYEPWIHKAIEQSRRGVYVWALLNQSNANIWQDTINQQMRFKINLRQRVKFYLNDKQMTSPRYDNTLVHFGPSDSYKNYLRSDGGNFPIKGELVYDIRKLGNM